jgi:pyruvate formate lyase activating enzyme
MKLNLGDIVSTSTLDWPGKVVLVVFMRGCPFKCPYCSNARFIEVPDDCEGTGIESVNARVLDASKFVDGVVFSGGEPFMQPAALKEMASYVKGLGLLVGVHTNGAYPDRIRDMVNEGLLDAVFLDIKAPLEPEAYAAASGGAGILKDVGRSLALCCGLRKENKLRFLEARTTVFNGIADGPEDVKKIASAIECADAYVIQQGRPEAAADERLKATEAVPRKELLELAKVGRQYVGDVKIVKVRTHLFGDEAVN